MAKIEFEIDYLRFDNDFEIDYNEKSIVIYGSNGMGKSSIYNAIRNTHPQYDYIDYNDMKNNFISGKSKEINVTPHAQKYSDLKQEQQNNTCKLDITDALKRYDINAAGKAKDLSSKLLPIQKSKLITENITISEKEHIELSKLEDSEVKFLLKKIDGLKKVSNIDEDIKVLKLEYMKTVLEHLDDNLEEECSVCPVCNSNVPQLKEIIKDKLGGVKQIKTEILDEFRTENRGKKNDEIIKRFEKLLELALKLTEKEIIDYMLVPVFEKTKEMNSILKEDKMIKSKINKAESEMIQSYDNLKRKQKDYTSYISRKFDADVKFSDDEHFVRIVLKRHPKEYSTGEFNLILFTTKIFEFVGSDKKLIILDDPISSYDIINQYKIVFDIISSNKNGEKNFLIFTHNMGLINLLNTQKRGLFEFKMLDKIGDVIHIYEYNVFAPDSIMSIDKLLIEEPKSLYTKYIQLSMERDNEKVEKSIRDTIHKLFHYDDYYEFSLLSHSLYEENITNQKLVEFIDDMDVTNFSKNNYRELVIYKIVLMLGLRVWIEKKLYNALNSDSSYASKELLADKINYALPYEQNSRVASQYPNLSRTDLMSRKVMLNQHEHYKSQGEPFYYVLNLSVDDVYFEIIELKKLFE